MDLIALSGVDAKSFAQSMFANDLNALQPGAGQWTTMLSAKGRVIAVFALFCLDEITWIAAVPYQRGAELLALWNKYRMRAKVQIQITKQFKAAVFESVAPETAHNKQTLSLGLPNTDRGLMLVPQDATTDLLHETSDVVSANSRALDRWHVARMQAGVTWLRADVAEQHTAHALGLEKLPAVSVKKGCYPGQEIVARTHFLGKNSRQLQFLYKTQGPTEIAPNESGDLPAAFECVEWRSTEMGCHALVVTHVDNCESGLMEAAQRGWHASPAVA